MAVNEAATISQFLDFAQTPINVAQKMHYAVVGTHLCPFFLKFFAPNFLVQILTKVNEFSLNPVLLFERTFLLERGFKHTCMTGNTEKISQKFHSEFFFTRLACFGPLNHASNQALNRGYIFVFLICQKKIVLDMPPRLLWHDQKKCLLVRQ